MIHLHLSYIFFIGIYTCEHPLEQVILEMWHFSSLEKERIHSNILNSLHIFQLLNFEMPTFNNLIMWLSYQKLLQSPMGSIKVWFIIWLCLLQFSVSHGKGLVKAPKNVTIVNMLSLFDFIVYRASYISSKTLRNKY